MQLDRTEIVIRQRTPLEIMDLSLLVLRRHFFQLIAASAALSFPVLAIDVWLCHWMVTESGLLAAEGLFTPETTASWRFVCHLIALYVVQFPLVSLPLTILLGAAMFFEPMVGERSGDDCGRSGCQPWSSSACRGWEPY